MPTPLIAPMPPDLVLDSGDILQLIALDQTTGLPVAGVNLSDISFYVRPLTGAGSEDAPQPLLVPTVNP